MNEETEKHVVISYYNEHVQNKLSDYIHVNARIEEAWRTLLKFAPAAPKRILEVGCGVGSICARMGKKWPDALITGIDISDDSITLAQKLFSTDKISFRSGVLTPETFDEKFDLIVFMDVYEHIAVHDRPDVHAALKRILNNKGRIILSVPTPHYLKWCLVHRPETMQPVDEHISLEVIGRLASDTGSEVMLYQIKNVWNTGDYAHVVLEKNDDFQAAFFHPKPVSGMQRARRILNKVKYKLGSLLRTLKVRNKLR